MAKRSRPAPSADAPLPEESDRRYHAGRYGKGRHFAVWEERTLVAVTLYRKGAEEVAARLAAQDRRIAELERRLAALATPPSPSPPATDPPSWNPPRQLELLAAEASPAHQAPARRPRPAPSHGPIRARRQTP